MGLEGFGVSHALGKKMEAKIVRASLQQCSLEGNIKLLPNERQLSVKKLVLQCSRRRRYNRLLSRENTWNQIGQTFPGSCRCFDQKDAFVFDRLYHRFHHLNLSLARLVALEPLVEQATLPNNFEQSMAEQ